MSLDTKKNIEHKQRVIKFLKKFNLDTNYIYDKAIKKRIDMSNFSILELEKDYKSMRNGVYKKILKTKPFKTRVKYFLDEHFPKLYNMIMQKRSSKK